VHAVFFVGIGRVTKHAGTFVDLFANTRIALYRVALSDLKILPFYALHFDRSDFSDFSDLTL
jgi:hypothetical protein